MIILQVGHNTKAQALAYMPLAIGGMCLLFQNKRLAGFVLTVFALAMQIRANHYQMTYYMLLLMLVIFMSYFIEAIKAQSLKTFSKSAFLLIISGILALGLNAPPLLATSEYTQFSTRGKSELTNNPDGTPKESCLLYTSPSPRD